jgi:hypothetical protein
LFLLVVDTRVVRGVVAGGVGACLGVILSLVAGGALDAGGGPGVGLGVDLGLCVDLSMGLDLGLGVDLGVGVDFGLIFAMEKDVGRRTTTRGFGCCCQS